MARSQFNLVVLHPTTGNYVENAEVTISSRPSGGATVYTTEAGGTAKTQPILTDAQGRANGWLPRGIYKATIVVSGFPDTIENFDIATAEDGSIVTAWINDSAITTPKIATGAVQTAKINDLAVTTAKLDDGSVIDQKIGTGAVTTVKLANDSVDASKLRDDPSTDSNRAVTSNHLRDGIVTLAKLGFDFNATVRASRLNEMTVPNNHMDFAGYRLQNIGYPDSADDAARVDWVNANFIDTSEIASYATNSYVNGTFLSTGGGTMTGHLTLGAYIQLRGSWGQYLLPYDDGRWYYNATTVVNPHQFRVNDSQISYIDGLGGYHPTSDAGVKSDFEPVDGESILASLSDLTVSTYSHEAVPEDRQIGVTAQDWNESFPELIHSNDIERAQEEGTPLTVSYSDQIGVLLAAVKTLTEKVAALEAAE